MLFAFVAYLWVEIFANIKISNVPWQCFYFIMRITFIFPIK